MPDQSFSVHLQSLFDFASELRTQLTGMNSPVDRLSTLATSPVLLGSFGEAQTLAAANQAAIAEMTELLGQIQQAIDFAENVTNTVATGYQQADQDISDGMRVSTVDGVSSGAQAASDGVWAQNYQQPQGYQSGGTWT